MYAYICFVENAQQCISFVSSNKNLLPYTLFYIQHCLGGQEAHPIAKNSFLHIFIDQLHVFFNFTSHDIKHLSLQIILTSRRY